jgi:hypothetical protein
LCCAASCREDWLAQLIAELDDTDSYEFVKHLTDVHRLHLFDIVMQYRAIFFDSSAQVRWLPPMMFCADATFALRWHVHGHCSNVCFCCCYSLL